MTVDERIYALRREMEKRKIDLYVVTLSDFHASEYVGDHFKGAEYISGFTGTNATVVVTAGEAGLWTDGRYFIQAKRELAGSMVKLFEMDEPGVPTVEKYIEDVLPEGGVVGFDGRCVRGDLAAKYEKSAKAKKGSLSVDEDLLDLFWEDRPALPAHPVWILEEKYSGMKASEKISWLRKEIREAGADAHLLTSLYDIAWLLNLRGADVENVPVFLSYVFLTEEKCTVYMNPAVVSDEVRQYLSDQGVSVKDYEAVYSDMESEECKKVLVDERIVNVRLLSILSRKAELVKKPNPTELKKSIKNDTEIRNTIEAHIKDGVAVTKFIYWLKKNIGKMPITELSAAQYLYEQRAAQEHFLDLSFETIAAYGPNAAMMHYAATEDSFSELKPEGFLLVDSGGHYLEGTTDITRTIVLGPITEEMKKMFTTTLRSHLRLAAAKFPEGVYGQCLDILARGPVWDLGLDYRCGTGHGVGHILNVHEGPQVFRWKRRDGEEFCALRPGMITTDEPGVYVEDGYGIRHENELLCRSAEKTEYGQFLNFEIITYAPFDLEAVDVSLLTRYEKETLNAYHEKVYETLAPHLSEEERAWLKHETRRV